jgi:hypothetical protein
MPDAVEHALLELKRFRPQPGDCFVLSSTDRLSTEVVERIQETFEGQIPEGCKVFVVDKDMQVGLVRDGAPVLADSPPIAGTGAEDMEGVGVAPAPTGLSADSGERPDQHQRRSDR